MIAAELVVAFIIGVVILGVLIKIMSIPFKLFWKFITNSIAGAIMLWIVSLFGVAVKINIVSALVAGVLGIPGVILIVLYSYM